ncbi:MULTISPECIES: acyltransferase domain-containing protein [Photorhabdus]|uniref:Acyltransferase domain-containing protein n=1 Tax=Photorhabdus bodei TaxID=2029681 RepID=A0AAW6BGY2_9GAMM|nr:MULTISPECIES: acyltransferase domain-containing protein [Photorhabdus]MDB6371856.1 acyltransferase domain-containing protein [Photorhabdus bodei]
MRQFGRPSLYTTLISTDELIEPSAQFAVQVSMAAQLRKWGLKPAALLGHSSGEMAACYLAGIYDLTQALTLLYQRYYYLQRMLNKGGGLLIVAATVEQILPYLSALGAEPAVVIAGRNSISLLIVWACK